MPYVEVAVNSPIPGEGTYAYEVPPGLDLKPGHGVYVPFGPRILQGVVFEVTDTPRFAETRPVAGLFDSRPLLSEARLGVARWISSYYLAPLFSSVALFLPPGFERRPQTFLAPGPGATGYEGTLARQAIVDEVVAKGSVEIDALKKALGLRSGSAIDALVRSRVLSKRYGLERPTVSARYVTLVSLAVPAAIAEEQAQGAATRRSRAADILKRLAANGAVDLTEARALGGSLAPINRLVANGTVSLNGDRLELTIPKTEAQRRAREMEMTALARGENATLAYLAAHGGPVTYPELRRRVGANRRVLESLAGKELVRLQEMRSEREPLSDLALEDRAAPVLTESQEVCANAIEAGLRSGRGGNFLLHGVTGSGKTEVYLKALQTAVELGRKGLVLVPEISLTPQTVRRFVERFPGRVGVLHSGLSSGEAFDQWHGARDGRYDVVIGARSAVFAPQPDLGLIVIDEQHEWTYKQEDVQPRYDARAVAGQLALTCRAVLVSGSATPRVESYHAALGGTSRLLKMEQRVVPTEPGKPPVSAPLPLVEVVDLREELRAGNRSIFSRQLQKGIRGALDAHEQVILFLNRRGSASFLLCRSCGFVPRCSSCGLAFSYHAAEEKLVCHGCNRRRNPYVRCPSCGGVYLRPMGAGTQKVEEEAASLFPEARALRWDRDVVSGKGAHERILATFLRRDADILIGTQMLAKGLDIPSVTLVGVVNADIGLNLPDFRSAERTFQLLAQVGGRSGRSGKGGRVIIQTYQPDHYAITAAAEHDYRTFFDTEIAYRQRLGYPPLSRLVRLTYAHTSEDAALQEASRVADRLREEVRRAGAAGTYVVGPAPAAMRRSRGRYRWDLLVKGPRPVDVVSRLDLDARVDR